MLPLPVTRLPEQQVGGWTGVTLPCGVRAFRAVGGRTDFRMPVMTAIRDCRTTTRTALLAALALASAGCQEQIELTRKPVEQAQSGERPSINSPVFVVARTSAEPIYKQIDARLPQRLLRLSRNMRRAACLELNGRRRCGTARLNGSVERDGAAAIKGTPEGFELEIPARYSFTAKGRGAARSVKQEIDGRMRLTAPFRVTLDANWDPTVRYSGDVRVVGVDALKILDKPLNISDPLARKFRGQFRAFARTISNAIDTTDAVRTTEETWRHLHYPVQLRAIPELWLRGDPQKIAFGGVTATDDTLELRIAIVGKIATFADARPVPLLAREMPELDTSPITVPESHLIMPVDLPYDEIAQRIRAELKRAEPLKIEGSDKAKGFTVTDVKLYPSRGRLTLAVGLESEVEGEWLTLTGTAYVLGTPSMRSGKGSLGLKLAGFSAPTPTPTLFDEGRFIVPERPLVEAFRKGMEIKLKDRFASVLGDINKVSDVPFAKQNRLRGRFDDLAVHSIETAKTGLRINLDVVGALSVYPGIANLAAELGKSDAVSAEQ